MRLFAAGLMVLVGAVFLSQPAELVVARLDVPALEGIAFGEFSWLLLPRAGDHPPLLYSRDAAARRPDHRTHLPPVRLRAAPDGARDARRAALRRRLYDSRTDVAAQRHRRCVPLPHCADALHDRRLRRDLGLPCHAVAPDGAVHGRRAGLPPGLLRRHDRREHRGADLGRRGHVVLGRCRGAERGDRLLRRAGRRDGRHDREGGRWGPWRPPSSWWAWWPAP